jgi:hypothetical protein
MKLKIPALIIVTALMMRCSVGGSFGDFAGGGVIGNPSMPTLGFGYVDSTRGRVVTTFTGQLDLGNGPVPLGPVGSDTALVNHVQSYSYPGAAGTKHFLFSSGSEKRVSSWSPDSSILWTWKTASVCSVQVQFANGTDTSAWSEPLIVHVIE